MSENHEEKAKILAALGGVKGLIDSGIPALVFLIAFNISHNLSISATYALALSAAITIFRLARRETIQNALSGVIGVGICFWFSRSTGKAEDFYLPGLITNLVYGIVYTLSILVGWPIIGVVLGPIFGENFIWRKHPERKKMYAQASWLWVGLFVSRLIVQYPLYRAGNVNLLGTARLIMGYPLFFATGWATWLIIKNGPKLKS